MLNMQYNMFDIARNYLVKKFLFVLVFFFSLELYDVVVLFHNHSSTAIG